MPDDMRAPDLVVEAHGTVTPPPDTEPDEGDTPDKEQS